MKTKFYSLLLVIALLLGIVSVSGQTFTFGPEVTDSLHSMSLISDSLQKVPILIGVSTSELKEISSVIELPAGGPAKSYGQLLFPHIPNQFDIATDKVVGEIPIQHQVTPTGSTVYNIPIEAPAGRQGTEPSLSITYNSQGGNGILGQGWGLGGISAVTRTIKSFYYNGEVAPVSIYNDQFTLDGMRLLLKSESTTVKVYEPEQGNMRIEAFLKPVGGTPRICYFKVWLPDGSTAMYGYTTNDTPKLFYPLTKATDKLGNTIIYNYTEQNNHYYISSITYGSSKNIASAYATISFAYKARTDIISGYENGTEIKEDKLLEKIECKYNNSLTRRYSFTYIANKVSLLSQVDCELSNGSLNPLKFYYGTGNPQTQLTKTTTTPGSYFPYSSTQNLVIHKGKFDFTSDNDALIVYPYSMPYYQNGNQYLNFYPENQTILLYTGMNNSYQYPVSFTTGTGFIEMMSGY